MASTMLTIGEFSRMTYLSVKALRHYHDVGVLAPVAIDPNSGYRCYSVDQVTPAQVIRRLRDLGMPLDSIRAVLLAPDLAARNREITAHLERMERQLEQTQAAVSGLRALLGGPAPRPKIEFRTIPPMTALAVAAVVTVADVMAWGSGAFAAVAAALGATGLTQAGPHGALFPGEFFELELAEITAFAPVELPSAWPRPAAADPAGLDLADLIAAGLDVAGLDPDGRVRLIEIAGTEAAVAVHDGPSEDIDRTYGALGTAVAERAIGVDGPIREYYPNDFDAEAPHLTEICWPVFRTARP